MLGHVARLRRLPARRGGAARRSRRRCGLPAPRYLVAHSMGGCIGAARAGRAARTSPARSSRRRCGGCTCGRRRAARRRRCRRWPGGVGLGDRRMPGTGARRRRRCRLRRQRADLRCRGLPLVPGAADAAPGAGARRARASPGPARRCGRRARLARGPLPDAAGAGAARKRRGRGLAGGESARVARRMPQRRAGRARRRAPRDLHGARRRSPSRSGAGSTRFLAEDARTGGAVRGGSGGWDRRGEATGRPPRRLPGSGDVAEDAGQIEQPAALRLRDRVVGAHQLQRLLVGEQVAALGVGGRGGARSRRRPRPRSPRRRS